MLCIAVLQRSLKQLCYIEIIIRALHVQIMPILKYWRDICHSDTNWWRPYFTLISRLIYHLAFRLSLSNDNSSFLQLTIHRLEMSTCPWRLCYLPYHNLFCIETLLLDSKLTIDYFQNEIFYNLVHRSNFLKRRWFGKQSITSHSKENMHT